MSDRTAFAARAYFYFGIFMITLYVLIGLLLIFVLKFIQVQPTNRIAAGCVLILYGCYRTFKLIRERKKISITNRDNEAS